MSPLASGRRAFSSTVFGGAGAFAVGALLLAPVEGRAQSCAVPDFEAPLATDVGADPRGIAVADFDRDGWLDLVTADFASDSLTVLWGLSTGGFDAVPTVIPTGAGSGPEAVAVGDFNRDGRPDIVVALQTTQTILPFFKNAGARTFTPGNVLAVNNLPTDVATGDFDRSGTLDVVTAGLTGEVQISFNDGTGVFANGPRPAPGGALTGVAVADFNRMGLLDVAVSRRAPTQDVVLLLAEGPWSIAPFPVLTGAPEGIAAGDLDRNGTADVVVAVQGANDVNILLGDGAGAFIVPADVFDVGGPQDDVGLADFDGDGIPDVVAAQFGSQRIAVGRGDGAGKFLGPAAGFTLGNPPQRLATGDFDNDGRPDVVVSAQGAPGQAVLFINKFDTPCPKASFTRAGRIQAPLVGNNPWAIATGDWDGDGFPDVAVTNNTEVSVLMGDGTLRLSAPTSNALPFSSTNRWSLVVADFNLDSRPDLATVNPNDDTLSVLLNTGGGTFGAAVFVPVGIDPYSVAASDFNGDGAPDLVSCDGGSSTLTFRPGQGDGTFGSAVTTPIALGGSVGLLAAGDIDGDPHLDVAVTYGVTNVVRWFRGDGAGGFTLGGTLPTVASPLSVDLGDLTGDGLAEIAVAHVINDSVSVFLNTGGVFAPPVTYPVGDAPYSVSIQPADDDTDADLVVTNQVSADVTVLLNDGLGGFPGSTLVQGFDRPTDAIVLDADRDGRRDLAVLNGDWTGGVQILPGDGAGAFGPEQVSPGLGVRRVVAADFDRDGKPDLVTVDSNSNQVAFLEGGGDGTFAVPVPFATGLISPPGPGVGDFDGNGTLDLVIGGDLANSISFLPGDGGGVFGPPVLTAPVSSGTGRRVAVGDFDRDGVLDFARTHSANDDVDVHYGDGAGNFVGGPSQPTGGSQSIELVALDFNRDGILDLAVSNRNADTITLLQGTGFRASPWIVRPSLPTGSSPTGLATGDLDRDGITDLLVTHRDADPGTIGHFRGTGIAPNFFTARSDYNLGDPVLLQPDGVATADFNGDGWLDALVACRGTPTLVEGRGTVRVLLGTGDPNPGLAFLAADSWVVAQESSSPIALADFDRNGTTDFAIGSPFTTFPVDNRIAVVLNTNCQARRLKVIQDVSRCGNTAGTPFGVQPVVQVEDHGSNPIHCNADPIDVAEAGGTFVFGTTSWGTTAGVVDWATTPSPPYMWDAGTGYRLEFTHPFAGLTRSWSFTVSPALTITGPFEYCEALPAFFSTDPGFDTYRWYVNPPSSPSSFREDVTIPGGTLGLGGHTLQVDATVDSCPVSEVHLFNAYPDLSSVTVAPPGPESVCTTCTGSTLVVTETDGGALTRRWGYRVTPGGAITYIPGQTSWDYVINGSDFPGQGTYYVVEETTPQCGVVTVSNEVQVQVTVTATNDVPPVFTVTSTDGQNRLEWAYPPGRTTVRIRYDTNADWLSCVPPATEADGSGLGDVSAPVNFVNHGSLTNDLTYCYSIFVETGVGVFPVATRRTTKGRPFDTSGPVKWAYSTGASSMAPPGLGLGVVHVVSNDEILHSVVKGVGGGWPASWTPFVANGPSQSRPSTVGISIPPANRVIYLGSQATAGNNSVAVDADTGMGLWGQPLGAPVQAGPAGIFSAYGGSMDAILLGTFDGASPNAFHALDPFTGNPLPGWPYVGEALNEIGRVSSQAAVDYSGDRVFFTSYRHAAGTDSVWCVELATGSRCPLWPVGGSSGLGHVAAGPTLRGGVLYVAPINGEVHALDADDGSPRWAGPFLPGDGQVKLFMLPSYSTTDLYFSTTTSVWSIRDDGAAPGLNWQRAGIPSPSQPVYYAGTGRVWVGGGDGRLYILNSSDGLNDPTPVNPIVLGDGTFAVGAPTVDQAGGFVYVGTDAGVVYAVAIP